MKIETAWYESSPYLHASAAVVAICYSPGTLLLKTSGFLLCAAALTILSMRWFHRREFVRAPEIDQDKYVALITQDLFYDADIK